MVVTKRQRQIIQLASNGLLEKQIALRLGISIYTLKNHLQKLYQNNEINNIAEAVARLMRAGVIN